MTFWKLCIKVLQRGGCFAAKENRSGTHCKKLVVKLRLIVIQLASDQEVRHCPL